MTQSPEQSPQPVQPEVPAELRALQLTQVEELRGYQKEALFNATADVPFHDRAAYKEARQNVYDSFKDLNSNFLHEYGINENHPKRDEYLDYLNTFSINNIPDSEWTAGPQKIENGTPVFTADGEKVLEPSGRDQVHEKFVQLQNDIESQAEAIDDTAETEEKSEHDKLLDALKEARERDPAIAAMIESLNAKRESLAKLTAKEIGKPFKMRSQKYQDAKADYDKALAALGREEQQLLNELKPDRTESEKHTDVIAYIFEQQAELRNQVNEIFQNTKVSKFIDKFGNFMARGSKGTRVAKGLGVGLAAGAIGGVVGTVGAAGVAVGTVGVISTRFIKNYALHDNERGMADIDESKKTDLRKTLEANDSDFSGAVNQAGEYFEDDKKEQQGKRRKALYWGIGGVALGATAGVAVHAIGDSDLRWVKKPDLNMPSWGNTTEASVAGGNDSGSETSDQPPQEEERANPPLVGNEQAETQPVENINYGAETETIRNGEGWFTTFKELGVPVEQHETLLNEIGPELVEQGIAYEDQNIGGYGIHMTPDGKMPDEALKAIVEAAHSNGIETHTFESSIDTTVDQPDASTGVADVPAEAADTTSNITVEDGKDVLQIPSDYVDANTTANGDIVASYSDEVRVAPSDEAITTDILSRLGVTSSFEQSKLINAAGPYLVEQGVGYMNNALTGDYSIKLTADGKIPAKALDLLIDAAKDQHIAINADKVKYTLAA